MATCKDCLHYDACKTIFDAVGIEMDAECPNQENLCGNFMSCNITKNIMTNADRIRAMSDEELAKECVRQFPMYLWPTEVRTIYFDFEKPNKNNAINAWIEWLKQPSG